MVKSKRKKATARKTVRRVKARRVNPVKRRKVAAKRRNTPMSHKAVVVKRKKTAKRKTSAIGKHRPVVYVTASGFKRSPKSKFFAGKGPFRINPKKRRIATRKYRHNPMNIASLKKIIDKKWLMTVAKTAIGIGGGVFLIPVVDKVIDKVAPGTSSKYPWASGIVHIVLGGAMNVFGKKALIKDTGLMFAGVGVYSIIADVAGGMLPNLHQGNPLSAMLAASYTPRATLAASYNSGYQQVEASYTPALSSDVDTEDNYFDMD